MADTTDKTDEKYFRIKNTKGESSIASQTVLDKLNKRPEEKYTIVEEFEHEPLSMEIKTVDLKAVEEAPKKKKK